MIVTPSPLPDDGLQVSAPASTAMPNTVPKKIKYKNMHKIQDIKYMHKIRGAHPKYI
jgi:hypothetical protein